MRRKIHREDILNVGRELMFRQGYTATGIKEITAAMDIPKGSFYNHFKSKEDFGLEVLSRYTTEGIEKHQQALLNSALGPINRLKKFYGDLVDYCKTTKSLELGCMMGNFSIEMGGINQRFRDHLQQEFGRIESIIERCLKEAKSRGELSENVNTKQLASIILNSWQGTILRMKATGSPQAADDFYQALIEPIGT